jgi:hypothetical protein
MHAPNYLINYLEDSADLLNEIREFDKNKPPSNKFNLFDLVAEKYRYENLHSDILAFYLNINEKKHNAQDLFLNNFIEYINSFKTSDKINIDNYKGANGATVRREDGRIDIVIKSNDQKKNAIIIENKINDAGDTYLQIPTYVKFLKESHYNIDAIVYLSKDGYKRPSELDWNIKVEHEIIEIIKQKIIYISAFNNTENDLVNGWIATCLGNYPNNDDTKIFLEHYKELLKKINPMTQLQNAEIEYFEELIKDEEKYANAFQVKKLLESKLNIYYAGQIMLNLNELIRLNTINTFCPFNNFALVPNSPDQVVSNNWNFNINNQVYNYYFRVLYNVNLSKFEIVLRERRNNNIPEITKMMDYENPGFIKDSNGYTYLDEFIENENKIPSLKKLIEFCVTILNKLGDINNKMDKS